MLAREGRALNHQQLYRLYREERLMAPPIRINQRWSLDFVSDTLSGGRRRAGQAGAERRHPSAAARNSP